MEPSMYLHVHHSEIRYTSSEKGISFQATAVALISILIFAIALILMYFSQWFLYLHSDCEITYLK